MVAGTDSDAISDEDEEDGSKITLNTQCLSIQTGGKYSIGNECDTAEWCHQTLCCKLETW